MAVTASPSNALARLGTLSVTLNDEARPGWLVMDGTTEYDRAAYPAFIAKFSTRQWILAGSTAAKFKMLDIRDMAFVVAGNAFTLGQQAGAKEFRLTASHLPGHTHTYDKPSLGTAQQVNVIGSVLGGVLTGLSIPKPQVATGQDTGSAGSSPASAAIPLTPLSLGVNVFVFAGLPQG